MVKCPLCGFAFDPAGSASACGTCPVGSGCDSACCPHCGYSFIPAPAGTHGVNGAVKPPLTVAELAVGTQARLGDPDLTIGLPALRTLVAYGLLPGVDISVLRTSPAFVLRLGGRTVSVDAALAAALRLASR